MELIICNLTDKLYFNVYVCRCVPESKLNHADSDCLAVIILSHGSEGVVFGRDGQTISIDQLVQPLKGTGCKSLVGKPKLFFIQVIEYYVD